MPSDPQAVLARHIEIATWPLDMRTGGDGRNCSCGQHWPCDAVLMARALAESEKRITLTPDELVTVFRAHRIGAISYEGDSWYAADAGYDYDPAEATMREAGDILARLARAALLEGEPDAR